LRRSANHYAPRKIFFIGGAGIYAQLLPRCRELYLSVVLREGEGDAFFRPFEHGFELIDVPLRHAEFEARHSRKLHA
jgi:dihydrofolate reductase